MTLLAGLSAFSGYWPTYFAAIFIIATAVTELEFLHILAAIIRGDKNYFDFRREFLTPEEAQEKSQLDSGVTSPEEQSEQVTEEQVAEEQVTERGVLTVPAFESAVKPSNTLAFQIEERALAWYEKKAHVSIQRYVRFSNRSAVIELDGVIQSTGRIDELVEVRWIRNRATTLLMRFLDGVTGLAVNYKQITKRECQVTVLIVAPRENVFKEGYILQARKRAEKKEVPMRILIVPYAEIDVVEEPETQKTGST